MNFIIENPTRAYVSNSYSSEELSQLKKELTYKNETAAYDVKRHYNNIWLKNKNYQAWQKKLEYLQSLVKNTLVFEDENGIYIRPSSLTYLSPGSLYTNKIEYPTPKKLPWAKKLPFELHSYQEESIEKLIKAKHANIELCTGSGKSAIILKLLRELGLPSVVVVPSVSIFNEMLVKLEYHLGKGTVGAYGNGKKNITKKITIAIADSLVNIKPDSPEYHFFYNKQVFITDESHLLPAETLEKVCHDLLSNVPYRFFLSGTQTRNDGTEMLLRSIIGPTVHRLSTEEAIRQGYICPHKFTVIQIESSNPNYNSKEPLEEKRIHFLNNKNIAIFIAKLANSEAEKNRQTLVLVEELQQIANLIKLLKVPYAYAHSDKNKEKLSKIGIEKVDSNESVEKFNKNEVKVLIGTSCIATGTNIFPTHNTVNWVGGASEIRTKQGAVGRSVRLHSHNPHKDKCLQKNIVNIYDFDVYDNYTMQAHLKQRLGYYKDSGTEIRFVKL